ncbi:MAG: hypothetical protein Q9220_001553 [cf. Caloplaca sp. 1 TL-2023]
MTRSLAMGSWPLFHLLLLLVMTAVPSWQVDIITYTAGWRNLCLNIPPGVCCLTPSGTGEPAHRVVYDHLLVGDIATVWGERIQHDTGRRIRECSGQVLGSGRGPGTFTWHYGNIANRAWGASYVRLPTAVPPDEKTSLWLAAEGMLGLVWGGGKWFADAESQQRTELFLQPGWMSYGHKRGIRSNQRGIGVYDSPKRWVYASIIEIDGTNYTRRDGLDAVYEDLEGSVLNLTASRQQGG